MGVASRVKHLHVNEGVWAWAIEIADEQIGAVEEASAGGRHKVVYGGVGAGALSNHTGGTKDWVAEGDEGIADAVAGGAAKADAMGAGDKVAAVERDTTLTSSLGALDAVALIMHTGGKGEEINRQGDAKVGWVVEPEAIWRGDAAEPGVRPASGGAVQEAGSASGGGWDVEGEEGRGCYDTGCGGVAVWVCA
jgi:hypothetical protein